jgi:hypothetical protein
MSSCSDPRPSSSAGATAMVLQKRRTFYGLVPKSVYGYSPEFAASRRPIDGNEINCAFWPLRWLIVRQRSGATSVPQLIPSPAGLHDVDQKKRSSRFFSVSASSITGRAELNAQ